MANFFDQFDQKSEPSGGNFFDQFDPKPPQAETPPPPEISAIETARQAGAIPEDPAERVALRMRAPYGSPFREGATSRVLDALGMSLGRGAAHLLTTPQRAGEAATALTSDQLSPEERRQAYGQIFEGGTIGSSPSVAAGTGRGVVREFLKQDPAARAQTLLQTQIPKGMEGRGPMAGLSQLLSRVPVVGTPLRTAAQEATEQLQVAGPRVAAMPAGREVVPAEAGQLLKREIGAGLKEGRLSAIGGDVTAARMARMNSEEAFETLANLARSSTPEGRAEFIRLRSNFAGKDWETIQGGMISKLGERDGVFDPTMFAQNWKQLSFPVRANAFGTGNLYRHLDAIADVSSKYSKPLARMATEPAIGKGTVAAAGIGAGIAGALAPTTIIAAALGASGPRIVSSALARPRSAASLAQWSRSYDRLINNPSPGAMAALGIATRNLSSTLGEDIDIRSVLSTIRENLPTEK